MDLSGRIEECRNRIAMMCKERRPPKMSIPPKDTDDDIFIDDTLRDIAAERAKLAPVIEAALLAYEIGERQRELGHSVSRRLRQLYAENVERVRRDVMQMEIRCERADEAMRVLREMGIDLDHVSHWGIRNRIRETLGEDLLDRLRQNALETLNLLNRVQPEKERQMVEADT